MRALNIFVLIVIINHQHIKSVHVHTFCFYSDYQATIEGSFLKRHIKSAHESMILLSASCNRLIIVREATEPHLARVVFKAASNINQIDCVITCVF